MAGSIRVVGGYDRKAHPEVVRKIGLTWRLARMKTSMKLAFTTCLCIATTGLSAIASSAVVGGASCGTGGCYSEFVQLGPVTRTRYGDPRVPVAVNTNMGPKQGTKKYWFIADCVSNRLGLYGNDADGADAVWNSAFTKTGRPNGAGGWIYDQWRLLCSAAGEL